MKLACHVFLTGVGNQLLAYTLHVVVTSIEVKMVLIEVHPQFLWICCSHFAPGPVAIQKQVSCFDVGV